MVNMVHFIYVGFCQFLEAPIYGSSVVPTSHIDIIQKPSNSFILRNNIQVNVCKSLLQNCDSVLFYS